MSANPSVMIRELQARLDARMRYCQQSGKDPRTEVLTLPDALEMLAILQQIAHSMHTPPVFGGPTS